MPTMSEALVEQVVEAIFDTHAVFYDDHEIVANAAIAATLDFLIKQAETHDRTESVERWPAPTYWPKDPPTMVDQTSSIRLTYGPEARGDTLADWLRQFEEVRDGQ